MPEPVEDVIAQNLIESLEHLHKDLDKVELWAAALRCFQAPVPDYQPTDTYLLLPLPLPPSPRRDPPRTSA